MGVSPCENVAYDPLISETCNNLASIAGFSEITFRALKTGVVTFHANASGEICDLYCYWGTAFDNGPAILHVVDKVWMIFLPVLQH